MAAGLGVAEGFHGTEHLDLRSAARGWGRLEGEVFLVGETEW